MSKSKTKLTNDPRVVVGVLLLLVVVAALRLPALIKEINPRGERKESAIDVVLASHQCELNIPANIQQVTSSIRDAGETKTRQQVMFDLAAQREARVNENLRNPFKLGPPEPGPAPPKSKRRARPSNTNFRCNAVFLGERSSAMLNGKIYFIGDRLRSYRVRSISADGVTVEKNGSTRFLALKRKCNSGASALAFQPQTPAMQSKEESR